jgi:hypothetical protein
MTPPEGQDGVEINNFSDDVKAELVQIGADMAAFAEKHKGILDGTNQAFVDQREDIQSMKKYLTADAYIAL